MVPSDHTHNPLQLLILLSHFIRRLAVRASKVHTHRIPSNLRIVNVVDSILSSIATVILDESKPTLLTTHNSSPTIALSVVVTRNVNICDRSILFKHIFQVRTPSHQTTFLHPTQFDPGIHGQ